MIIQSNNLEETKKLIKKSEPPIIVVAGDEVYTRKLIEYGRFDVLIGLEYGISGKERGLRQIDSGFNHVLGELMTKNKISYGIDFKKLRNLEKQEKGQMLMKLKQNILLCKKSMTPLICMNIKDSRGAGALLSTLGASSEQSFASSRKPIVF